MKRKSKAPGGSVRVLDLAIPEVSYQRFFQLPKLQSLSIFLKKKPNKPLQALFAKERVPTNSLNKQGQYE